MNCEEIKNKLNEYIDGELSKEETIVFEMHLYECKDCKNQYMALTALSDAVKATQCADLPEDFDVSFPKERKLKYFWRKYEKTIAVMVAAAALIIFASGIRNMPVIVPNDTQTSETAEISAEFSSLPNDTEATQTENCIDTNKAEENIQSSAKTPEKRENTAPNTNLAKSTEQSETTKDAATAAETISPNTEETRITSDRFDSADAAAASDTAVTESSKKRAASEGATVLNSMAKSAQPAASVDLSPLLSYSMPPQDSFTNPDRYDALCSRLSSLKSRAGSAHDSEKQSILNEFYALRQEISYNLK